MTIANHVIVFIVCWWLVFFMVLPWGVRGHHESGENYQEGIEPGSPVNPHMKLKVLVTTGITIVVWGLFWAAMAFDVITLS